MMTTIILSLALVAFIEGFRSQSVSLASRAAARGLRSGSTSPVASSALFYSTGFADPDTESVVSPPPRIVFKGTTIIVERGTRKEQNNWRVSSEFFDYDETDSQENFSSTSEGNVVKSNSKKDLKCPVVTKLNSSSTDLNETQTKLKNKKKKIPKQTPKSNSQIKPKIKSKPKRTKPSAQYAAWHHRYQELVAFHDRYGHSLVPQNYPPNPKLGQWIMAQRRQYTLKMRGETNSLTEERMRLLEDLGFVWRVVRRGPRGGTVEEMRNWNQRLNRSDANETDGGEVVGETMDKLGSLENFEAYLIRKREEENWNDDELLEAWRERFRILDQFSYYWTELHIVNFLLQTSQWLIFSLIREMYVK